MLKGLKERANSGILRSINRIPVPPIFLVIIGILIIFSLDLCIPAAYSLWALYFIPIYIESWIDKDKSNLYYVTSICVVFILLELFLSKEEAINYNFPFFNRLLDSLILFAFSYLLSKRRKVTSELKEEKKLAEELAEFNGKILESSPYGIAVYENTGQCTYVNEAFFKMIGAQRDDALNQNFHEIQSWKDSGLYNLALKALNTHHLQSKELNILTTFGKEIYVDCRLIPFRLKEKPNLLVAFGDITEAKRSHQALLESEEKFSKAFKANPNALILSKIEDGTIIEVNDTFLALFEWSKQEVIGTSTLFLKMYSNPQDRDEIVKQLKIDGKIHNRETWVKTRNGENRIVILSAELLQMSGEKYFLTTLQDITERKQIEEERERILNEFERQQAWLNTIIDQMPSGLSITDAASSGKLVYHNDQAVKLSRHPMLPSENYKVNPQYGALHRPDLPYMPEEYPIVRALKGETVYGEEMLYCRGDGTFTYFSVNAAPVKDSNGKIIAAISTFDDISEQKQMQEALLRSEEKFRRVVEHINDALIINDLQGNVIFSNDRLLNLFGFERERLDTLNITDYIAPEYCDKLYNQYYHRIVNNKTPVHFECEGIQNNGNHIWLEVDIVPVEDGNGKLIGTQSLIRDISGRKHAEKERESLLRENESQRILLTAILDQLPIGISISDGETGKGLYHNKEAVRLLGYNLIHADNNSRYENYHAVHKDGTHYSTEEYPTARTILTGEIIDEEEMYYRRGEEEKVLFSVSSRPVIDSDGKKIAVVSIFYDISERKQAENALRASEELYRSLIETSPDAICMFDAQGILQFASHQAALLYGAEDSSELVGKHVLNFLLPEDHNRALENINRLFSGEKVGRIEYTFVKDNGNYIPGETSATLLNLAGENSPPSILVVIRDITDRKQVEKSLKENHEKQVFISNQLLILQGITNQLSKVNTSEELCRQAVELGRSMLGFDRMSIWFEGKEPNTIEGCFGTDEFGRTRDERNIKNYTNTDTLIWHALTYKEPFALQKEIPLYNHLQNKVGLGERIIAGLWNGDNSFGFVSADNFINHIPFSDQQCEILGLYASTLGYLIPRKYAEEALKASEERLLEAQKLAHLGNYTLDVVSDKIEWSDQMYELWETDRNKPAPTFSELWSLIHPDDRDYLKQVITEDVKEKEIVETEFRILLPDGRIKYVHLITRAFFDDKGNLVKRQGVEIDITERKVQQQKLEATLQELERSNKDLEQFAYTASHDLQEPIRMVKSYADLLNKRYKGVLDEKAQEFLGFITEGSSRMQNLISDLLKYSRINTQAKPFEKIDSNEIVNEVLEDLKFVIKENKAVIRFDELPNIKGDKTQIRQVFQNLIQNAIKFKNEKNPEIEIKCEKKKKKWLFSVKDNGIGIEQEHLERIFVIFQRLHEREKYPGTGIGLAIVKKIVERHGGEVCVESEINRGSIFYFTLPV